MTRYRYETVKTCARCDRDYYGSYSDHKLSNEHTWGLAARRPHPFDRVVIGTWCRLCGEAESSDLHEAALSALLVPA